MKIIIAVFFCSSLKWAVSEMLYDLCIIGAGMFGSAAAKHASAYPGLRTCLIGPDEPTNQEKKYREIFGSHYDEGRIVETTDPITEIQVLSRKSIEAYRELERLSGMKFYSPFGLLVIGKKFSPWMERTEEDAAMIKEQHAVDLSSSGVFQRRFPYLRIEKNEYALFDDIGAGYINPRKMIEAQQRVATMQGCHIIRDVVEEVSKPRRGFHQILTTNNGIIRAKRVLLTTGAFTNFKKFYSLPKLQLLIAKVPIALLRISNEDARKISSMPPIVYSSEDKDIQAYILPPIRYPDGHNYLKIGLLRTDARNQELFDLKSIKNWYMQNGDRNVTERTSDFLMTVLPSLKVEEIRGVSCVTANTPTVLPYIDRITTTLSVAVGGNGRGAKICEEVGRLASLLSLTGAWDSKIPKRLFNAIPQ